MIYTFANRGQTEQKIKAFIVFGVAFNLFLLIVFKYTNFLITDVFRIYPESEWSEIVLPIAISFYTFQQIAFVVDMYRNRDEPPRFVEYALFVSFFPQLIAGPIVHHQETVPQFNRNERLSKLQFDDLAIGLTLFSFGLFKKVVLADSVAEIANPVFSAADSGTSVSTVEAWMAALAYTFQLYFDFSGYSDMAIGLARLFGVRLPINFFSPYKSASIIEFWRRWHITLSRFLRDYLYIALGGSRNGQARRLLNIFITMLLGGIWHGAGWTFVLWGALHGFYITLNHLVLIYPKFFKLIAVCPRPMKQVIVFVAVVFGWVLFRSETIEGATELIAAMSCIEGCRLPVDVAMRVPVALQEVFATIFTFSGENVIALKQWPGSMIELILLYLAVTLLPNTIQIMSSYRPALDATNWPKGDRFRWRLDRMGLIVSVVAAFISLALLNRAAEFLYFQF